MVERLHPGVYTEEKSAGVGPVQGVSTSNLGLVGFTLEGEVDKPILSTSFVQWAASFGSFTEQSLTPTMAFLFFQNGGGRIYTVRTVASDAATSGTYLSETATGETGAAGTGAATYDFALSKSPIVADSVSIVAGSVTFTDNASGILTGTGGGGGSGSVDYNTGDVHLVMTTPSDFNSGNTSSTYTYKTFEFDMKWPGLAGDDYRVRVTGEPDYEVITSEVSEAKFSRFKVYVEKTVNSEWIIQETFSELSFTDTTATYYITTVINDDNAGSNIITVTATGNNENPTTLEGVDTDDEAVTLDPAYDGSEKAIEYTIANPPYPLTVMLKCTMLEDGLLIGLGDGTATPTVTSPQGPLEAGNGTLLGAKVVVYLTLTTAGADILYDAGNGDLTDDGTTGGTTYGTVNYTTGAIAINYTGDTTVTNSQITLDCEYSNAVDVSDDGAGIMAIDEASTGPTKFTLSANADQTINYTTGKVDLTWKITGDPAAGPATGGSVVVDYYTTPVTELTSAMTGGSDGASTSRSDVTAAALAAEDKGMYALNKSDELMQVVVADFQTDPTVAGDVIDYCANRKDRFAIVSVPEGLSPTEAVTWKKTTLNKPTSYAALYYPHIKIMDPVTEKALNVPAGGHLAGIYARTDNTKNVAKAPAGTSDGSLRYLIGLERSLTSGEVDVLDPNKVNSLIDWPYTGMVVWGADTLELAGGEFGLIQVRRLFMFLSKSIFNSTHIHVFENNDATLWAKIRFQITSFLLGLYNQNYFSGNSPDEAFFVICDRSNNPQETVDQGLVFCDIGVAPKKAAKFIVFRLQQKSLA